MIEHNVWLSDKLGIDKAIHILDYYDYVSQNNSKKLTYTAILGQPNRKPTFAVEFITRNVSENSSLGMNVYSAKADDIDQENLTYSFKTPMTHFQIDTMSGSVILTTELDYELQKQYKLDIIAEDSGTPKKSAIMTVVINVMDENDNAPVFTKDHYTFSIENTVASNITFGKVEAEDLDSGENGDVSYSVLDSSHDGLFAVNKESGLLSILSSQVQHGVYNITVEASDHGQHPMKTTVQVTVVIVSPNLFAPEFETENITFIVYESSPSNTYIGQVIAYDNDNTSIDYYIPNKQMPFKISEDGKIFTDSVLDREHKDKYSFKVEARDNGKPPTGEKTATIRVFVEVKDVNDNTPVFADIPVLEVPENATSGTSVGFITANDADEGDNAKVTYFLQSHDADVPFAIVPATGEISVLGELDRENKSSYSAVVNARDSGIPQQNTSEVITINITDINDWPPIFTSKLTLLLPEDTPVNSRVYQAKAKDKDIGTFGK